MKEIKSDTKITTKLPPCALQSTESRIYCGSYKLDEETGTRNGAVEVYDHDLNLLNGVATASSSILDIQLQGNIIYTANSTGNVQLRTISDDSLKLLDDVQLREDSSVLLTQLALSKTGSTLAATSTDGSVSLTDMVTKDTTWTNDSHSLEAWTCHYDKNDPNGLITGGDDMFLCYHDVRAPGVQWKIRAHDAGVVSLLTFTDSPGVLWTGGYDDNLNIIDLTMRRRKSQQSLGGGVWRLLPNKGTSYVMACCMYNGAFILENVDASTQPTPIAHLSNHESMVYGGAWLNQNKGVTCSFYDKLLQTWTFN